MNEVFTCFVQSTGFKHFESYKDKKKKKKKTFVFVINCVHPCAMLTFALVWRVTYMALNNSNVFSMIMN